jgi:hypothetical protein
MEVGNGQTQAQRRESMHAVLGRLLLEVPRALLEPEARVDLLLAADRLPNALSWRNVGLELRLQGPPRGDLFVAARPTAPDGLILHDSLVDFPGGPAGDRLSLALSQWRQGLGWFAHCCQFVLLEVDASQRIDDSLPPPAVFLIPQPGDDLDTDIVGARNPFHRDPEGLVAALAELAGESSRSVSSIAAGILERSLRSVSINSGSSIIRTSSEVRAAIVGSVPAASRSTQMATNSGRLSSWLPFAPSAGSTSRERTSSPFRLRRSWIRFTT